MLNNISHWELYILSPSSLKKKKKDIGSKGNIAYMLTLILQSDVEN